jgi:parallel beta-helix repeat protein
MIVKRKVLGITILVLFFIIFLSIRKVYGSYFINLGSSTNQILLRETTDNSSLSIWNITFRGGDSSTFWINLPKYSKIVGANLNLSGYYTFSKTFQENFVGVSYLDTACAYIPTKCNVTILNDHDGYAGFYNRNDNYYQSVRLANILPVTNNDYYIEDSFSDGIFPVWGYGTFITSGNGRIVEANGVLSLNANSALADRATIDLSRAYVNAGDMINFEGDMRVTAITGTGYLQNIITVGAIRWDVYGSSTYITVYRGGTWYYWTGNTWTTTQRACGSFSVNTWYRIKAYAVYNGTHVISYISHPSCTPAQWVSTKTEVTSLWLWFGDNSDSYFRYNLDVDNVKINSGNFSSPGYILSKNITSPEEYTATAKIIFYDTRPTGTSITYYMTADGYNWQQVSNNTLVTFNNIGNNVMWKAVLSTNNPTVTPKIKNVSIIIPPQYTSNPYLDVANSGWPWEWNYSGTFNESVPSQIVDLNTSLINNFLSVCVPDDNGTCDVPIKIHSDTPGKIQVSGINVSYKYNISTLYNVINDASLGRYGMRIVPTANKAARYISVRGYIVPFVSPARKCYVNGIAYDFSNDICYVSFNVSKGNYWPYQNISLGSPYWFNMVTYNSTPYNLSIFNITWSDTPGYSIDTVLIEGNFSGVPRNYTMFLLDPYINTTEKKGIYSFNISLAPGTYYWKSYANASDGVWNVSDTVVFTVGIYYISSCQELNINYSTYYLTRDIINSPATVCINIRANNVTLDCQGHIIDGIDALGSTGILVDRGYTFDFFGYPTNVTIRNCILTDWGEKGISFFFASNNVIENVTLDSNFMGIYLGMSMYNKISKVISKNNDRWGIYLGGNTWFNNISDSIFENNGWQGIYISDGWWNLIYNNIFNNTNNFYIESDYYEYWNTTKQPGTNIWNSSLGYIGGNFWTSPGGKNYSDTCNDFDADGFCDSPYMLDSNNFDYLPIARVVGQYFIVKDVTTYDKFLNQKASFTNSSLVRIRANVSHYQGASVIDKVWCKIIDNSSSLVTIIFGSPVSAIHNVYTYECNYTIPSSSARGNWNVIVYANDTSSWQVTNSTTFFVYLTFSPSVASPFSILSTQFLTWGIKSITIFNIPQLVSIFQARQVFQAFSFHSILSVLLPVQSFTSFTIPQLISSYINIQTSQTIPINYFKVLSTYVSLISSLTIQSISKLFLSSQLSQTISINYYYILLATIKKYQPLTFSSLLSLLQESAIYQSFSLAGVTRLTFYSFLSSSFNLLHRVFLLIKVPSIAQFTFTFYSSLYSSIAVLHSINLQTIISLLSSLSPIQQFLQLIHRFSLLFAYNQIYIYAPYGAVYGLNETVFINGTVVDKRGAGVPNASVSLFYYKTSEDENTETYWGSTTTDEYGNFNFTWYNENVGNWTLVVKYYAYGVMPFKNSTSVLTITPAKIQDISPSSWWYKENEKSFYTQIMNLTANVGIKDIKAFPTQDNITQPFYRSTLNGLYSECRDKEINQSCLIVGRFRFPSPGNYTLNNTLTIYYQRGNLYVFNVLRNVSVENVTKEDFTTSLSLSSTKYGDIEKNIRAGEPRHYAWLGDTTNVSFMLNSSKVCTDVYVRMITPFGEDSKYVGIVDSSLKTANFIINTSSSEAFRGFGMDSFVFEVNSSNGCYGVYLYPVRLLPPKNAELIIQAPDVVTAGSLFTIGVSYRPHNYSIFYPHVMLDLSGTFGFEVGTSRIAGGAGRCYNVMLWSDDYMPGVTLSYQTTEAGTVFTPDSLRIVPQYYYYLYDKYGFLNIPKTESYYVRKIYIGYGVLQPGDWKMYGAYSFMIGNFSAETGVIYSDWSLSPIQIYKFLDVTEVPQFFNVITNLYGRQTAVQLGTFTETKQFNNWIAFYPRNFPPFSYISGNAIQTRTFPEDPSTYWIPCLSAGHSPLSPPFSVYVEYQKTGEDAFSVPAGQRLASILNEWVEPGKTSSSIVFQAIAPVKPGIYNISAIVYDDAETGLYWVVSKTIRVLSTLAGMQVTVSQEDFPAQEIWAKPYNNNVTMIRKVLVTNYQENDLSQVAWIMNPLPADATYVSGARSGVIDFLPSGATVNPSNVTYVIPGVIYTISGLTYDSASVDLGKNVTGKVSFYVYGSSISTDFVNVKVNTSELVPYDSVPEKNIITIDRIFSQQKLFYQIGWTSRTGYEITWGLNKGRNYVYTAKVHFYNNNSKDIQVNYYVPLVRLPDFDPRNIVKLSVNGKTNIGFLMTRDNFIIILKGMTEGDHDIYMEYVPYVAPLPMGGGGGAPIYPEIRMEPKTYNYTGLPTNLTIWYELTCLKTSCSVFIIPSGAYTSWVEIPKDLKYGWTLTGFLFIPKDGTARFPVYVKIPEATPDGFYNITLIAEDISTKVQAKATINIWISRVIVLPVPIYKVVAIAVLVLAIILYINWEKVKKLIT